jgi:hypothetical protein
VGRLHIARVRTSQQRYQLASVQLERLDECVPYNQRAMPEPEHGVVHGARLELRCQRTKHLGNAKPCVEQGFTGKPTPGLEPVV